MTREEIFIMRDKEIEKWSYEEKLFVLWQLLKHYRSNLSISGHADTIEDYIREKFYHDLYVSCDKLIDMIGTELWR